MKAKLIIDGKEFNIKISNPEFEKLLNQSSKTGYERVENGDSYFYVMSDGHVGVDTDYHGTGHNDDYSVANYYSDRTVAENNARADRLIRQLRRFAVEHGSQANCWGDPDQYHYYIMYDYNSKCLFANYNQSYRGYGAIYFDNNKTAELAIETFHDELIWYFTEYEDSL